MTISFFGIVRTVLAAAQGVVPGVEVLPSSDGTISVRIRGARDASGKREDSGHRGDQGDGTPAAKTCGHCFHRWVEELPSGYRPHRRRYLAHVKRMMRRGLAACDAGKHRGEWGGRGPQ